MSNVELYQFKEKENGLRKPYTSHDNQGFEKDGETYQHDKIGESEELPIDYDEDDNLELNACSKRVLIIQTAIHTFFSKRKFFIVKSMQLILLLAYLSYVAYAMYYSFGSEPEWRLLICTIIGLLFIFGFWLHDKLEQKIQVWQDKTIIPMCSSPKTESVMFHLRWVLKVAVGIFIIAYLVIKIAIDNPQNMIPAGGVAMYIIVFYVTSVNPAKVDWHPVFWGLALQFIFALITLETTWGYEAFKWAGDRVKEFLSYSDVGAKFVFGDAYTQHYFAFKVMPVLVFLSTMISILYYIGLIPFIIKYGGRFLGFCMGTRPAESISAIGNIFLGMTDLPLMLRPLLATLTNSEIHAIMTGGFATIAGTVLGAYIAAGVPANHLLTASVMSAPAALALSKIAYPELEKSTVEYKGYSQIEKSPSKNIFDAATNGAMVSAKIISGIIVNVMAFLCLLEFANVTFTWFGDRVGIEGLTLELVCSYVFYPIAFLMGADIDDCRKVATLVAKKTFTNEFIAYADLATMISNRQVLANYTLHHNLTNQAQTYWWTGDDVVYNNGTHNVTLPLGIMSDRSEVVSTYALCGFANFGSMGIMLGALASLEPSRKHDFSKMVLRAMITGNAACFLTGSIAGLLYHG